MASKNPIPHKCPHEWSPAVPSREVVIFGPYSQTEAKLTLIGTRECTKCHVTEEFKMSATVWPVDPT